MELENVIPEILEGSDRSRIHFVTKALRDGGIGSADDLKYFDWKSLGELGGLSDMEINKIMRFIKNS